MDAIERAAWAVKVMLHQRISGEVRRAQEQTIPI